MALLIPEGERANREGLSQGLSNYYNSPGRLAVFRRKFECNSPNRSGSCHARHRVGNSGGLEIWVLAPATGWSGTGLLQTNGVSGDLWKIHSGQLGALRWSRGFRYLWLVWSRLTWWGPRRREVGGTETLLRGYCPL